MLKAHMTPFTFLQTISLVCFLVTLTCTLSSLTHDEECSALFQFKQTIIHKDDEGFCGASWFQTFHSWKRTTNASDAGFDCCFWDGVECSNHKGYSHVIGLDLSESSLCGHINSNSTLFSLIHLKKLNLAMNYFYESQIPSEIGHLKYLRSLNLSDSGFKGQIPIEISHLMQLSSLDLSSNPLKLKTPGGLKDLVQNLTGVEELHLSGVDIGSSVPRFLANFSSLRSIKLKDCLLQNEFPTTILELPKLKVFDVASNTNLTGSFPEFHNKSLLEYVNLADTGFFGIVPESTSSLNHLIVLSLSRCSFSGRIPDSLSNLTQLTDLGLAYNKFTGLVPSLEGLSKLSALELTGNKFKKGRFPNWLGKLTKLNQLYVNDMNINGEIPHFLENLTELSVVVMGMNSLIGRIPSLVFNLTQMRILDLQYNQLQGPISSSFSNFKSLQHLQLHFNNFHGRVDLDMFLQFNKLETLTLGDNKISLVATNNHSNTTLPEFKYLDLQSCNLKEFPAFLHFQNKLKLLFLGHNRIEGLVPEWIGNISRETLQMVQLSHNYITGFHQHPYFLPWRRLEAFFIRTNQLSGKLPIPPQTTIAYDVSNNYLTGGIPPLICEAKSLRLLDLSSNSMSGTLPPCIGSLSNSILVLNLRRNNFHGSMMNEFTLGSLLKRIDLSENQFHGQISKSLVNCTNLEVVSLGDNSLDDEFPLWLGTLDELQVLILRSNKFHGAIQVPTNGRSQFPKLHIIDLSNNSFSGQLPRNYFQTWNAMKSAYVGKASVMTFSISAQTFVMTFPNSMILTNKGVKREFPTVLNIFTAVDLSSNNFVGEIPQSLQDLRGLESLNLSNNHFSGHVLSSLGYLTNLESLDLSQNKLSGKIPQELMQLGFLEIFNVSFNHLYGRIPQGKQFNTFENNSYMGNSRLCGRPLSKECQDSKASTSRFPPAINTFESLFPNGRIDWIIIFCGVGSGLVIGTIIGNFLHAKYSDRFENMKDKWIRPLRNSTKDQGGVIS